MFNNIMTLKSELEVTQKLGCGFLLAFCDVYVGGKVRVLELMRFFYLKHSGPKINFVL